MAEIKRSEKEVDEFVVTKEVEGKKVIDNRGKEIGRVKCIHMDPRTFYIGGITLGEGLFKDKDFVGSSYISSISEEGVVLTIIPITEYVGMDVFDSKGMRVGVVKEVERVNKSNNVLNIVVDRGYDKGDLIITEKFIGNIGENIVLNDVVPV